jgi:hypothetical protein
MVDVAVLVTDVDAVDDTVEVTVVAAVVVPVLLKVEVWVEMSHVVNFPSINESIKAESPSSVTPPHPSETTKTPPLAHATADDFVT